MLITSCKTLLDLPSILHRRLGPRIQESAEGAPVIPFLIRARGGRGGGEWEDPILHKDKDGLWLFTEQECGAVPGRVQTDLHLGPGVCTLPFSMPTL